MKVTWLVATCLLIGALLLTSCAPAAQPATPTSPTTQATPIKPAITVTPTQSTATVPTKPLAEKPKYGGVLNVVWPNDPPDWDQAYRSANQAYAQDIYCDKLAGKDWAQGPNGTGVLALKDNAWVPKKYIQGLAVEDWEYPDPTTTIFHVRKGVRFHNKPPVNGREMTSKDVAVTIQRMFDVPTSWLYGRYKPEEMTITTPDKYTVVIKWPYFNATMEKSVLDCTYAVPADLVRDDKGKETGLLRDWKNAIGTGPFVLTDYVAGSSITTVRNRDYWQRDPLHPENQLPYVDGLKVKIIPEAATVLAALRTGSIDYMKDVAWQDVDVLAKTNPNLKPMECPAWGPLFIYMRTDIKPFSDKRVRQALSMAIDRDGWVKDLYGGHATRYLGWIHPACIGQHVPENQLSPEGQATFKYDPKKAKELLAQAGYPNGFDTEILSWSTYQNEVVLAADYWKKIGVNAKIDLREFSVYNSVGFSKKYAGCYTMTMSTSSALTQPDLFATDNYKNYSVVSDPWWDAAYKKESAEFNEDKRNVILQEMGKYAAEQTWVVEVPLSNQFVVWQPWLKGFNGAYFTGTYGFFRSFAYVWIDKSK